MTGKRNTDPKRLDVATFAAEDGMLTGEWPLSSMSRLMEVQDAAAVAAATVGWRAAASLAPLEGAGKQPMLQLAADATVGLVCQRCLQPMAWPLHAERTIFFVEGEDAAATLDAESEDDVLAYAPQIDLRGLVEDELLLALPIVPRHDVCPEPLVAPPDVGEGEGERENPFAVLAALKGRPPS